MVCVCKGGRRGGKGVREWKGGFYGGGEEGEGERGKAGEGRGGREGQGREGERGRKGVNKGGREIEDSALDVEQSHSTFIEIYVFLTFMVF